MLVQMIEGSCGWCGNAMMRGSKVLFTYASNPINGPRLQSEWLHYIRKRVIDEIKGPTRRWWPASTPSRLAELRGREFWPTADARRGLT